MNERWDNYFLNICATVASNSRCLSRQIGAICVRDKSIISTGYNGPPRNVPECGAPRIANDDRMSALIDNCEIPIITTTCPRYLMGAESGDMLDFCIAAHAESNCIANAAKVGVSLDGSTMYMTCGIPCRFCLAHIINAGIIAIVCNGLNYYDKSSEYILTHSKLLVREFGKDF